MKTKRIILNIFIVLVFVNFIGVALGDSEATNNTTALSLLKNISEDETNQSVQDILITNNTSIANGTKTLEATGGIKNFMKSFKFQSNN
jgi:hypothetical protein